MSAQSARSEDEVREDIVKFLKKNFPQIEFHGGNAVVSSLDLDNNKTSVQLGGACSGCGVSPMTIQAIKKRLTKEIPEINTVHADTGEVTDSDIGESDEDTSTDAEVPF